MKVSISLGGSLLTRGEPASTFRRYATALRKLKDMGHTLIVVCGGGKRAREWIEIARNLDADAYTQDRLGIHATHLNALLLIAALGPDAHPHIHRRGSEIRRNLGDRILVGGGHLPGSSTDYRAVLFAEAAEADLIINATDVSGVYDMNPKEHPEAVKLDQITYPQLERIILNSSEQEPGKYRLFDLKAVKRASRLGIPLVFVDGSDPSEIIRAVEGGHRGTVVSG
jgi:uridylate kinase